MGRGYWVTVIYGSAFWTAVSFTNGADILQDYPVTLLVACGS